MTAQRIEDADVRAPGDPRPPPHDAAPVMLPFDRLVNTARTEAGTVSVR